MGALEIKAEIKAEKVHISKATLDDHMPYGAVFILGNKYIIPDWAGANIDGGVDIYASRMDTYTSMPHCPSGSVDTEWQTLTNWEKAYLDLDLGFHRAVCDDPVGVENYTMHMINHLRDNRQSYKITKGIHEFTLNKSEGYNTDEFAINQLSRIQSVLTPGELSSIKLHLLMETLTGRVRLSNKLAYQIIYGVYLYGRRRRSTDWAGSRPASLRNFRPTPLTAQ